MDILVFKSKDVPWKIKCQRLVDHVHAVFTFGSEKLVVDHTDDGKDQRWETKTMRLFRFKRQKEETWVDYNTRTCTVARKIRIQMCLPFLQEKIAEIMWRAMGWVCDGKGNTVEMVAQLADKNDGRRSR